MNIILQWIDFIWLPVILLVVNKQQKAVAAGMFLSCALMMRLQIELIESTGFNTGLLNFLGSNVHNRALAVYNIFYMAYVMLALFSPRVMAAVFLGASITIFFAASITSMIVMVL